MINYTNTPFIFMVFPDFSRVTECDIFYQSQGVSPFCPTIIPSTHFLGRLLQPYDIMSH